jgi:ComF family protein
MHPKRLCERGYNQAALLARHLARLSSGAVNVRSLQRVANTAQQARLNREERSLNLQNTMQSRRWHDPRPAVLVDDVLTTGATLLECARALNEAGANVIGACVIALAGAASSSTGLDDVESPLPAPEPELGLL